MKRARGEGARRPRRRALPLLLAPAGGAIAVLCWTSGALALPALPSLPSLPTPAQRIASAQREMRALSTAMSLLGPHLPAWLERWLYNPRERTAAAIASVERGDGKAAVAAADTAQRLAPGDPLTSYNAGSARLTAGNAGGAGKAGSSGADRQLAREAEPLLEQAVKAAGPDLAVAASYNLGNARLAAGDFAGAVEAYKQTLRAAPGHASAKYNLELAWREQQRQQQDSRRALGPRGGGGRPREGERQQTAGQGGSGAAGANPRPSQQAEQRGPSVQQGQSQGRNGQAQAAEGTRGQPSPLLGRQPLSGYQDQPEMSAAEAAAVLEAVQNLERQQRRQAAARQARQHAANGEDW
jgi:tetratricopeptide (TPR) repeat protein